MAGVATGRRIPAAVSTRLLYLLIFLFLGGYGSFFPIWLEDAGWSASEIGWLDGINYLSLLAWPLVWGHLADRWGSAMSVQRLISVAGAAAFAPVPFLVGLWPLMVAMTVFFAFRVAAIGTNDVLAMTYVQRTPGQDYGRIRSFGSAGFVAGGFLLAGVVLFAGRHAVPSALLAILVATAGVALASRPLTTVRQGASMALAARRILARPVVRRLLIVTTVNRLSTNGLYFFLALHLTDLGVPDVYVPVFWAVGVTSEIVLFHLAPRLFGRCRPWLVLALCFAGCAVQYGLTALIRDPWWLLPVMALHGLTFGTWYYTSVLWLGREVEEQERATAQALFQCAGFGAGGSLSAIAAGYLFEAGAGRLLFGAAAAASLVTLALCVVLLRSRNADRKPA